VEFKRYESKSVLGDAYSKNKLSILMSYFTVAFVRKILR
jgi:hypothetical protein